MSTLKSKPRKASVDAFLKAVEHETRRRDAHTVNKMMTCITGENPKMWGETIVGFGSYHYKYASGREGDWFLTGFSPRKTAMSPLHHAGLWPFRRHNGAAWETQDRQGLPLYQQAGRCGFGCAGRFDHKIGVMDAEQVRQVRI